MPARAGHRVPVTPAPARRRSGPRRRVVALAAALLLPGALAGCARMVEGNKAKSTLGSSEAAENYRGRIRSVFVEDRITAPLSPSYTQGIKDAFARCGVAATVHRPAEGQAPDPGLAAGHDATLSMHPSGRASGSAVLLLLGMASQATPTTRTQAKVVEGIGRAYSHWPSWLTDDEESSVDYVLVLTDARTRRAVWRSDVGIFRGGKLIARDTLLIGGEMARQAVDDMAAKRVLPCGGARRQAQR